MNRTYIVFVILSLALSACATSDPSIDPEFTPVSSFLEYSGEYVNASLPSDTYLSEALETVSGNYGELDHKNITSVVFEVLGEGVANISYRNRGSLVFQEQLNFDSENESVILFSKNGFLPAPSGGLTIGPQSLRVVLYKTKSGSLKIMKSEATYGLTLLIIPGGRSVQEYWTFERI